MEKAEAVRMHNPDLPTILEGYAGNTFRHGRFVERYMSRIGRSFWPVLKWKFSGNPKRQAKREDTFQLSVRPLAQLPPPGQDCLVWLGHASFLLRAGGRTLLLDPVLAGPRFLRRRAAVPLDWRGLAADYALVSHGHYDHLDLATLAGLRGAGLTALVPLRLGALAQSANPAMAVQEAGWYQRYDTGPDLQVTLLPAQHWHRRGLGDYNACLWGSFLVRWGGRCLYFAGDTGYNGHFREIRAHSGPIDLALLPIGAYDPPRIMQPSHLNPEEAVQAFRDLEARTLVPMHYGTFDLSDEPPGEPLRRLRAAVAEGGLAASLRVLDVGEFLAL